MVRVKNFNEFLEQDLDKLAANIKERQALVGEDKSLSREAIKESLKVLAVPSEPAPVSPPAGAKEETTLTPFLPTYFTASQDTVEIQNKIEDLIKLVFKEGLAEAIKQAKKYPPFVEDAFHDALIDKLMPELKKRGIC